MAGFCLINRKKKKVINLQKKKNTLEDLIIINKNQTSRSCLVN